jgi:16S rRNA (cytosine1402-N4)-methyltransferase
MHTPVLKSETLDLLDPKSGETIFEGTGGEGNLSLLIVEKIGSDGKLVVTDLDEANLTKVKAKLSNYGKDAQGKERVICKIANFRAIINILSELNISGVDGILLDLGLASPQIEESGRGFTFMKDEPLIMTFASTVDELTVTASDVVNTWSKESLTEIFKGFGGEKRADKIATQIVELRRRHRIETTGELVKIIENVYGGKRGRIHPATRVFQALRMAVNDEMGALRQVLRDGWDVMNPKARFVVISFHEIEDREVKRFFQEKSRAKEGVLVNKKPVVATRGEIRINPRSRSAKLRAIIKN